MRGTPKVVILALFAISASACSASHSSSDSDPVVTLKRAATRSEASSSVTVDGTMIRGGRAVVSVSGSINFVAHRDALMLASAGTTRRYPPYEARFVEGWSYVQIDPVVSRPPTVRADADWIAYQNKPPYLPVPDVALPPRFPLDIMNLPLGQGLNEAHFIEGSDSSRTLIAATFTGTYGVYSYTYTIHRGWIEAITAVARHRFPQSVTLHFVYGTVDRGIVAPQDGVQRMKPGETLYPPTTVSA